MKHIFAKCTKDATGLCGGCRAEGMDCMYDALSMCVVCHGMEGSLLPYCPGVLLTLDQDTANYRHYCARTGPFAQRTQKTVFAALEAIEHMLGARRAHHPLYAAMCELWFDTQALHAQEFT